MNKVLELSKKNNNHGGTQRGWFEKSIFSVNLQATLVAVLRGKILTL